MIKVREVDAGPDFKLALKFSDGSRGVADMRALVEKAPFRKLANEATFREAYVDHGAVEWPNGVGIASEALYAMSHGLPAPETLEQAEQNELEMSLRELRQLAGVTQVQASDALEMNQGQLSRLERQDDWKLSTLRRYVEALGAEFEVVAVLDGRRITLRGV